MEAADTAVVAAVKNVAERHGITMAQAAFAWHWAKTVASPILGATKEAYLDEAVRALEVKLSAEDIAEMEAPYVPHPVVGAINANPPQGTVLLDAKK